MRAPILTLLCLLCFSFVVASKRRVPQFEIDLDLKPFDRWREVAARYGRALDVLARSALGVRLQGVPQSFIKNFSETAPKHIPEPYRSELAGFAHYGNMSLPNLVALQFLYEIDTQCTSIVCVDSNNRIWHLRNLDFGYSPEEIYGLKALTIEINFIRSGKTVVKSPSIAGAVGLFTGVRVADGGFSISINQRNTGESRIAAMAYLFNAVVHKNMGSVLFKIRDALTNARSYYQALDMLRSTPLITPCYIIIGGLSGDQGAVITRRRNNAIDVYTINQAVGRWYVVETNYDRWVAPPPTDNRRAPAHRAMNAMGRKNITSARLFDVLYTYPVKNYMTIYSSVMSASQSLSVVTTP